MKYLITESTAKKMAFEGIEDVINDLNLYTKTFDSFIIYAYKDEDDFVGDSVVIEYDSEDGRLYVQNVYFQNVLSLFGFISIEEQKELFSDWFEYYEGIRPEYVDF